jgi:DNA repair protein RadD
MMIKLRYYQEDAISAIFKYFSSHTGNPILALPTGTGKSIVIAEFVRRVLQTWPGQRIIMLTHVKELIAQNAAKLQSIWPNAPMGIYSAGLNSRDMMMPIVFGGVQSVSKAIERAKRR